MMQYDDFDFLDDTLLIKEENENKTAKRAKRASRRRKSKMTSLDARRAVEELMMVKQYQSYEKLYEY